MSRQRLRRQHHVLAQQTGIQFTAALGRGANADEVGCVAEHILEIGVTGDLVGVLLHEDLVDIGDELLVLDHAPLGALIPARTTTSKSSCSTGLSRYWRTERRAMILLITSFSYTLWAVMPTTLNIAIKQKINRFISL